MKSVSNEEVRVMNCGYQEIGYDRPTCLRAGPVQAEGTAVLDTKLANQSIKEQRELNKALTLMRKPWASNFS